MDQFTKIFIIFLIFVVVAIIIVALCKSRSNREFTYQQNNRIPVRQHTTKSVPNYRVYTPFNTMYARNQNNHNVHHYFDEPDQIISEGDCTREYSNENEDMLACDVAIGVASAVTDIFNSGNNTESSTFDYGASDERNTSYDTGGQTYDYGVSDTNDDYTSGFASDVAVGFASAVADTFDSGGGNQESTTYDGGNDETTYDNSGGNDYTSGFASDVAVGFASAVADTFDSGGGNEESTTYDGGNDDTTYDNSGGDTTNDDGGGEIIED